MNVKVQIRGAPQHTRQEIELKEVPTTIARSTLCDLVWDKLLAVQICTVFDGDAAAAPEDVPWDRGQGELVLTDQSGAHVVGDTIDRTSIPLPLHAFESTNPTSDPTTTDVNPDDRPDDVPPFEPLFEPPSVPSFCNALLYHLLYHLLRLSSQPLSALGVSCGTLRSVALFFLLPFGQFSSLALRTCYRACEKPIQLSSTGSPTV
jgi:hypothetical protein